MKRIFFLIITIIFSLSFSTDSAKTSLKNNFFIKGTFEDKGVRVKFSGVVNFYASSENNDFSNVKFHYKLASFYIDEAVYKQKTYRSHDLFGITFPHELAVKLEGTFQMKHNGAILKEKLALNTQKYTPYQLSNQNIQDFKTASNDNFEVVKNGIEFKLQLLETQNIEPFFKTELFIDEIISYIKKDKQNLTPEDSEKEYLRLLIEGNNFLNENNYDQALISYKEGIKYTSDKDFIQSKIEIVDSYLNEDKSKFRWTSDKDAEKILLNAITNNLKKSDLASGFATNSDRKVFKKLVDKAEIHLEKKEYNNATAELENAKKLTTDTEAIDKQIRKIQSLSTVASRKESSVEDSNPIVDKDTEIEISTNLNMKSYSELIRKGRDYLKNKNYTEAQKAFEEARSKTNDKASVDRILASVKKLAEQNNRNNQTIDTLSENNNSDVASIDDVTAETTELLTFRKGYVKYKRDEQAVVDSDGEILIPFGKHKIVRYRAGFARIILKDSVELKKIECLDKNDEYSWSARIFQNPWQETVINNDGEYVDDILKKVEVYVVDNVSLLPYNELSKEIIEAYRDPNPHIGTEHISAHNLWERKHSKEPHVVARRAEIERFKDASKKEAYRGADRCREQVAKSVEKVYEYYRNLGYEVIIK